MEIMDTNTNAIELGCSFCTSLTANDDHLQCFNNVCHALAVSTYKCMKQKRKKWSRLVFCSFILIYSSLPHANKRGVCQSLDYGQKQKTEELVASFKSFKLLQNNIIIPCSFGPDQIQHNETRALTRHE